MFALLLVVQATVILIAVSRAGFFNDDIINHWIAADFHQLSLAYLFRSDYGHLSIGQRAFHYFVLFHGRLHWEWVVVAQVLFGLLISLAAWRMVRVLAGPWWALAGTAVIAVSPLWGDSWPWWSSAVDYLISLPACYLALELACRRMLGGPRSLSLGVAASMGVAFAFRERPAVLPAVYLLLALALLPDRLSVKGAARSLASLWDLAVASAIPVVIYVWLLLTRAELLDQLKNPKVSAWAPHNLVEFIGDFLARVFVPSLVGILPMAWPSPIAMAALGAVLVGLLALLTAFVFPRGWRMIGFLIGSTLLSLLPVAIGRGATPVLALQPRYGVEILPIVTLTLALLGREWEAGRVRAWVTAAWRSPAIARAITAGSMLGLTGVVVTSLFSGLRFERAWSRYVQWPVPPRAQPIIEMASAFRRSLRALDTPPGETFIDGIIPPMLLLAWPPEKNDPHHSAVSALLAHARPDVSIGQLPSTKVSVIESDAGIHRYHLGATVTVPANALHFSVAQGPLTDDQFCGDRQEIALTTSLPADAKEAVLIEVLWGTRGHRPPWLTPIRVPASGNSIPGPLVPGVDTSRATAAVIRIEPGTAAVGFQLATGFDGCIAGLRVTDLVSAP